MLEHSSELNVSRFRRLFLASTKNMDARNHLKSTENIEQEQKRQLRYGYVYTIHPFSSFKYFWSCLMCIVIYILPILETLALSFEQKEPQKTSTNDLIFVKIIIFVFGLLCYVDLIIEFVTGYYDMKKRSVQLSLTKISIKHVTSIRFIRNLVFALPSYYGTLFHESQHGHTQYGPVGERGMCYLRDYVSVLTLAKVWRFVEVSAFLSKHERFSTNNKTFWKLTNLLMYTTMLYHMCACLVVNIFSLTEPKIYKLIEYECSDYSEDSWIICDKVLHIYAGNIYGRYFKCLLKVACVLALFGDGVKVKNNYTDRILTVIMRLLGIWNVFYITYYTTIVMRSTFTGERKFQMIKGYIMEMSRHKKLPIETTRKLVKYFEYKYDRRFINETKIMSLLSPQLRKEIVNHCRRRLITDIDYFSNFPDIILNKLVEALQTEIYMPYDVVLKKDSVEKALYILASGIASMNADDDQDVTILWKMEAGAYFGQRCFIENDHEAENTVVALEICEFKVLFRDDFLRIMIPHRNILSKLQDTLVEEFIIFNHYEKIEN